jgi:hypothetical protein
VRRDLKARPHRAQSIVRHHRYGLIVAVVELPAFGNHAELIAHEFEHIVEQLEGVNLRRLAYERSAGVYVLGHDYETDRAHRVGLQVARECLRATDRTVTTAKRLTRWAATSAPARAQEDSGR